MWKNQTTPEVIDGEAVPANAIDQQPEPSAIVKTGKVIKTDQKPAEDEEIVLIRIVDNNEEYHAEVVQKKSMLDPLQTIEQTISSLKYKVAVDTATPEDIEKLQLLTS